MNAVHVIDTYWKLFGIFCEKTWSYNFKPLTL